MDGKREEYMRNAWWKFFLVGLIGCAWLAHAEDTTEKKIKRAMSAAPESVAKDAKLVDADENGKITVLRDGTNGFTCFAGRPGVVGDDPICMDATSMQWVEDLQLKKQKPTTAKPGICYMLAGGTDWSATDPFASSGTPIKEPPHWMMLWPFDPKTTGLSDKVSDKGTWIMWAGTPWAHLMINQKP